jgi:hypothetical protein
MNLFREPGARRIIPTFTLGEIIASTFSKASRNYFRNFTALMLFFSEMNLQERFGFSPIELNGFNGDI